MKKIILFLVMLILSSFVQARPQIPTQYYGVVSMNNNPVSGKEVMVKDYNGIGVSVNVQSSDADGIYVVQVQWDDPDTGVDEGVTAGDRIYFYVDGILIKDQLIGNQGDIIEIPLAIAGEETTSPSFARPAPSGSSEEIPKSNPELYEAPAKEGQENNIPEEPDSLESGKSSHVEEVAGDESKKQNYWMFLIGGLIFISVIFIILKVKRR